MGGPPPPAARSSAPWASTSDTRMRGTAVRPELGLTMRRKVRLAFALLSATLSAAEQYAVDVSGRAAPASEPEGCATWAAEGQCEANPSYMRTTCARACLGRPSGAAANKPSLTTPASAECTQWAGKGECEKNPTCPARFELAI